jgi:predicted metal-dependent enzyme (double-stranded beta helix superfamily)
MSSATDTLPDAAAVRGPVPGALRRFIWDIQSLVELDGGEREILVVGGDVMARLLADDSWLPTVFAIPGRPGACQYQLYHDGLERFSVVSTVLAPGASLLATAQPFWEIAGVLRGGLTRTVADGSVPRMYTRGAVDLRGSGRAARQQLANPSAERPAIAIHVYGGPRDGCANPPEAPPYDIWSIQTEIRD